MELRYHITVKEYLDTSWSTWFDDLTITHDTDGMSTLAGSIRDQSALYGRIARARDLELTLVAVGRSAPPGRADEPKRDRSLGWNTECTFLAHRGAPR